MYSIFTFDARRQTWTSVKGVELTGSDENCAVISADPSLLRSMATQWADCSVEPFPTRQSAANFAAAYAVGAAEYAKYRRHMTTCSSNTLLSIIRPFYDNESGRVLVHLFASTVPTNEAAVSYVLYQNTSLLNRPAERAVVRRDGSLFVTDAVSSCAAEWNEWHEACTHFTLEKSSLRYAVSFVCDASGVIHRFCVHTNCEAPLPFGDLNGGPTFVAQFSRSHRCNQFCKVLKLRPLRRL